MLMRYLFVITICVLYSVSSPSETYAKEDHTCKQFTLINTSSDYVNVILSGYTVIAREECGLFKSFLTMLNPKKHAVYYVANPSFKKSYIIPPKQSTTLKSFKYEKYTGEVFTQIEIEYNGSIYLVPIKSILPGESIRVSSLEDRLDVHIRRGVGIIEILGFSDFGANGLL